ncbi:hypothetical protein C8A01DRAFT_35985 [Parachaetomium inaequale]|uniref:Transmembrane protein n=1 Tax=Parachaetomium inaequale TaxID=2588326 RepID=A0AAN6PH75_9PEZI|nr:hypothetical protein C8A01DRAFT_35985 [Parachaetomium inaequale]
MASPGLHYKLQRSEGNDAPPPPPTPSTDSPAPNPDPPPPPPPPPTPTPDPPPKTNINPSPTPNHTSSSSTATLYVSFPTYVTTASTLSTHSTPRPTTTTGSTTGSTTTNPSGIPDLDQQPGTSAPHNSTNNNNNNTINLVKIGVPSIVGGLVLLGAVFAACWWVFVARTRRASEARREAKGKGRAVVVSGPVPGTSRTHPSAGFYFSPIQFQSNTQLPTWPPAATMAPTRPPMGRLPIMKQQGGILIILLFSCIVLLGLVFLGDRRAARPGLPPPSPSRRSRGMDSDTGSPRFKGKGIEPSETTPLLSPEPTVVGSESESSSTKRTDSDLSWLSAATDGS